MRPALGAVAIVGAVLLTGCGGPPTDASKAEFCAQVKKTNQSKSWSSTKENVAALGDVGTPAGISKDARTGFEDLLDLTEKAKTRDDLFKRISGLDKTSERRVNAFDEYLTETCPES